MWQRGRGRHDQTGARDLGRGDPVRTGGDPEARPTLTTDNSNGTAIAVADDGTVHVAWTMGGAVYHASTKLGGTSTVEKVFDLGTTVEQAGPLGRPGIALDGDGAPWIAFTAETSKGQDVHVAHLDGHQVGRHGRRDHPARCNGCPSPQPTGIGVVGGAPLVVYADPAAGGVASAHPPRLDMDDHGGRKRRAAGSASPSAHRRRHRLRRLLHGRGQGRRRNVEGRRVDDGHGCRYRRPRRDGDGQRAPPRPR